MRPTTQSMRAAALLLTVLAVGLAACGPAGTATPDAGLAATETQAASDATQTFLCCTATPPFTPTATRASATAAPSATATSEPTQSATTAAEADGPGVRAAADMVFHAGLGMVVLLNGSRDDGRLWGWDGTRWQVLAEGGPEKRELGGMAYDARRGVLVVYGGRAIGGGACLYDTWEWDGQAWQQLGVSSPDVCSHFGMEYDLALGKVVVFGGGDDQQNTPPSMWTWDGATWEKLETETPEPRFHAMSAYDPVHERLFLLGGFNLRNEMMDELWAWDANGWEQLALAGPPALSHGRMVFDAARTELVVFGGTTRARTPFDLSADTWRLTGGAWQQVEGPGPAARGGQAMAYDAGRERVVLYGGFDANGRAKFADTWEWDGQRWACAAGCE
jgi:hypothetical protein